MKIVSNKLMTIISLIFLFLLLSCYNPKTNSPEVALLKKQKQELEKLLIHSNEEVNKLKDENFELGLLKKELDQINNNENYDLYKKELSKYIEENINDFISHQPDQGGAWVVTEIVFINPFEVKIHCEDGHDTMETNLDVILQWNKIKIVEKNKSLTTT